MIDRLLVRSRSHAGPRKPRGLVLVPDPRAGAAGAQVAGRLRGARDCASPRSSAASPWDRRCRRCSAAPTSSSPRRAGCIDHIEQRTVDLSAVEILMLDEADRMLDMGFLPPLKRILGRAAERAANAAVLRDVLEGGGGAVDGLHARSRPRRRVGGQLVASAVTHRMHPVPKSARAICCCTCWQEPGRQTLVFCRTKHGSNRVVRHLELAGVNAAAIHGNKSQGARTRALDDFKAGRVNVLVATDIAARGLDIVQLPLVMNFDLPHGGRGLHPPRGPHGPGRVERRAVSLVCRRSRTAARIQKLLTSPSRS